MTFDQFVLLMAADLFIILNFRNVFPTFGNLFIFRTHQMDFWEAFPPLTVTVFDYQSTYLLFRLEMTR